MGEAGQPGAGARIHAGGASDDHGGHGKPAEIRETMLLIPLRPQFPGLVSEMPFLGSSLSVASMQEGASLMLPTIAMVGGGHPGPHLEQHAKIREAEHGQEAGDRSGTGSSTRCFRAGMPLAVGIQSPNAPLSRVPMITQASGAGNPAGPGLFLRTDVPRESSGERHRGDHDGSWLARDDGGQHFGKGVGGGTWSEGPRPPN